MALEINDLINQFKVNDNLNKIIGTRSQDSDEECECVSVTKCARTSEVLDKINTLSKLHPQRKTLISYIRGLICDPKNRGVRCCGENTDRDIPQIIEPVLEDEEVSKERKISYITYLYSIYINIPLYQQVLIDF